ncbi:potassium channel subfamily K member 2-like [Branchiostoma lanceolatum]|uniref:KCNK10 protein n=1 Tax=Branchiostoma lanceolatum TaxID=7740 RepID=A0A8J9ZT20_BRALA|nr:KCNK10 [Branchiostoma lanceolatum]
MKAKVVALLCFLNLCWLLIGGGVFSALEWQHESAERVSFEDTRSRLLQNYSCLTEEEVTNFIRAIVTATNAGLTLDNSTASDTSNWDFGNSVFFSSTVISTIGYGHISPSTYGGQAFLVPYALIGIPLCGLMLNGIGENIGNFITKKKEQYKKRWSKKVSDRTAEVLVMLILFLLFLVFLVLIPSAIFLALEGWSYHISIYYSFVTLTTIGFGDYVPGQNSAQRVVYRLAILCWFMIGLSWMAVILNQVSTFLTDIGVKAQTAREERKKKKEGDVGEEGEENKAAEDEENWGSTKSAKQSNVELRNMTPIES